MIDSQKFCIARAVSYHGPSTSRVNFRLPMHNALLGMALSWTYRVLTYVFQGRMAQLRRVSSQSHRRCSSGGREPT